ncbi:hypothetical protein P9X10_02210 [Bacillus cereus]|nr:hypothetical protein [Bacillus cereus]
MRLFYTEFFHATMPNQQLCQEFIKAETREKAIEDMKGKEYVGLLLSVVDRGEATEEDEEE